MRLSEKEQKVYDLISSGVSAKIHLMNKLNVNYRSINSTIDRLCKKNLILATASGFIPRSLFYPVDNE